MTGLVFLRKEKKNIVGYVLKLLIGSDSPYFHFQTPSVGNQPIVARRRFVEGKGPIL